MSDKHDEKALKILEKAVYHAQNSLEKIKYFQSFLMLLTDEGEIEVYENEVLDAIESYTLLEDILKSRIIEGDIDVMILAADTQIPEKFAKNISNGIRLHLEEKSQVQKPIAARFIYVPYELYKVTNGDLKVRLHAPIPVGFPAEYIVK